MSPQAVLRQAFDHVETVLPTEEETRHRMLDELAIYLIQRFEKARGGYR